MFEAEKFINESIAQLKQTVKGKALIAFSGGVDSTVCAALVHKAIGKDLIAVHVDTGFMRKGETSFVGDMLSELDVNFRIYKAGSEYFEALRGVTDPEMKRKIIGERFIRNFETVAMEEGAEYCNYSIFRWGIPLPIVRADEEVRISKSFMSEIYSDMVCSAGRQSWGVFHLAPYWGEGKWMGA